MSLGGFHTILMHMNDGKAFKRFCVIVDRSQVSKRWRALKDRSAVAVLAGKISSKRRRSPFGSRVGRQPSPSCRKAFSASTRDRN